ncbi:MAG: hypothetical protein HZA14_01015, partial [Nitrospirae bacterium]|nr:hypothetical protein [Nitrospirota bacterium]
MKIALEDYLGSHPFLYGRDLIKRMGIKGHYVDEHDVIDFLGFEIKKVKPAEYPEYADALGDIFDDETPAVMIRDMNLILLADNLNPHRERTTLVHESGHEIVPWHPKFNLKLIGKDIDLAVQKTIEREAFHAGSEIMYPIKHFVPDSLSLSLSFNSVSRLASRYNGSFEATSIRYALTNRNIMAIVVVKENDLNGQLAFAFSHYSNGERFLFDMPAIPRIKPQSTAPLRVQYCSHSCLFPKFIKSGTEIEKDNIIYECWSKKQRKQGEIPASV